MWDPCLRGETLRQAQGRLWGTRLRIRWSKEVGGWRPAVSRIAGYGSNVKRWGLIVRYQGKGLIGRVHDEVDVMNSRG